MASKKFGIEFEGFEEVIEKLSKLDGDIRGTTEKALKKTHEIVTGYAARAIEPHRLTGATEDSLVINASVSWMGTVATIPVGFDIRDGGLASIFLMYGTPSMAPDKKLYYAFFAKKTINEVRKAQQEIFYDEIRRLDS